MDKFSLYDFMSYFLPGVVCVFIALQLMPAGLEVFTPVNDVLDGLIFSIAAIVTGLSLHRITFFFIDKWHLYKKLLQKPLEKMMQQQKGNMKVVFEKLNTQYNTENLTAGDLFDEAYHYMEYNDKISAAKGFQSMYFFLRNLITLGVVWIPFFIAFLLFLHNCELRQKVTLLLCGTVVCLPVLLWTAFFFRTKMVERLFYAYYIFKIEEDKQKRKQNAKNE